MARMCHTSRLPRLAWGTSCSATCSPLRRTTLTSCSRSSTITTPGSRSNGSGTLSRGRTAGATGSTSTASSLKSRWRYRGGLTVAHSPKVCTVRCATWSGSTAGAKRHRVSACGTDGCNNGCNSRGPPRDSASRHDMSVMAATMAATAEGPRNSGAI